MPSRPVSSRRYLVRRVVALMVAAGSVLAVVALVRAVVGSDDGVAVGPGAGETTSPSIPTDPPADISAVGGETSEPVPETSESSAPAVEETEDDPVPSPTSPARVLVLGDSDAGTFGPYLGQLVENTGVAVVDLDYKVSSGLARPDFFDWQTEIETRVEAVDPDIVVVTFGGNDGQALTAVDGEVVVGVARPGADNSRWTAEYRSRVKSIVEYLDGRGLETVWVGIPNHADPEVRFRMQLQDEAVKAELAEHPDVRFVDTWTRFAGRSGNFADLMIDPRDGVGKVVRASDGFHLNQTGAEILAIDISQVVFDILRAQGAAI